MPELYARIVRIPGSSASIVRELRKGAMHTGGGGVLPYQSGGGVPPEAHGAHGERER